MTGIILFVMALIYAFSKFSPLIGPLAEMEIIMTKDGSGVKAENGMMVSVHYEGRLEDGTVFDASRKRGEPISFVLGSGMVIQGWEEGIEGMSVGEKRTLTIPPELGYGADGADDVIPPNATLTFDVELMDAIIPPILSDVNVSQVETAIAGNIAVIDIRNQNEWEKTGIIEDALTMTAFTSQGQIHPEFLDKFNDAVPTKNTPFILYCLSSGRTHGIGRVLVEQLGFTEAAHLVGGIEAWLAEGKETITWTE